MVIIACLDIMTCNLKIHYDSVFMLCKIILFYMTVYGFIFITLFKIRNLSYPIHLFIVRGLNSMSGIPQVNH